MLAQFYPLPHPLLHHVRLSRDSRVLGCFGAHLFKWSAHGNIPTQLTKDTFEALQIVKSAFCNGILNASDEAAPHVAAEWDFGGLVDREDSSDPV
jgi:hypothetical protein